jgi:hypothetical protein
MQLSGDSQLLPTLKVMSHDIYEHKIKIGEIKTKMCRLKILDCLSQWGL